MSTFVTPNHLTMRVQICDYCTKPCKYYLAALDRLHGIMTCDDHLESGKRDVKAFFHQSNVVKMADFLQRFPFFNTASLRITRSDGSLTEGCTPRLSTMEEYTFIAKMKDIGPWSIPLSWPQNGIFMSKYVPFENLHEQGNISQADLENILTVLDNGFYKAEFDARAAAGDQKGFKEAEGVHQAHVEGLGECRVYLPPNFHD